VAQIAARLDDRFKLLTRGARGALPRHQTLRALIDWSYDSLPEEAAALLRRLSVFSGGWTLEAAEAVCKAVDSGWWLVDRSGNGNDTDQGVPVGVGPTTSHYPPSTDVLDLLDGLVDRSLVLVDAVAEGLRYRLLETVREYARQKLDHSGELAAVRNQHRDWYLQLAEQVEAAASASERTAGLTRLEAERDNLRMALTWCQEAADADPPSDVAEMGLRLAMALGIFWYTRGHLQEGLQWLEGALARGLAVPAEMRAIAYLKTAPLAFLCGHRDRSQSLVRQARQAQEEVLARARAAGEPHEIAKAILILAEMAAEMKDLDAAGPRGLEARERMAALGEQEGLARALRIVGEAAIAGGDTLTGRAVFEERLAVCRQLDESTFLVHALGALGHVVRDEGDYALARSLYIESLALRRKHNHRIAIAQSLEDLAALARREQQPGQAIRLLGAATAFCETLDAQPPVAIRAEYEHTMAEGRAALGEAAFAAAWAEGRAMSLDEAIEYALGAP
jgi:non-specific serine/threonine protein kinase